MGAIFSEGFAHVSAAKCGGFAFDTYLRFDHVGFIASTTPLKWFGLPVRDVGKVNCLVENPETVYKLRTMRLEIQDILNGSLARH